MIAAVLAVTCGGFSLGAIVMAIGNRRAPPAAARARWLKLGVFFVIVHAVLASAALGRPWVLAVLAVILLAGTVELYQAWGRMPRPRPRRIWPAYALAATSAVWNAARLPSTDFALLFIAAAACDGFSQVVGQWLGRRPLAPRVSPAKTVEGFAGGVCAAVAVSAMIGALFGMPVARAAVLGLFIACAGLVGDLSASWVKRRAGIKDYSSALPGQGGFLDRFDSLLGALVLAAWWL